MKQAFNPYLPSWEYIPDGEPHVFGNRVYVFGSHDFYNGHVFCLGDYVCWSAPLDDLGNWKCEGTIYCKTDDPVNKAGKMCLYAPDVTVGPDGRYYLYYALDKVPYVSVAVCNTPAGKYSFYGYVKHTDGVKLGEKEGDEPLFDPAVLTEGDKTYLYTGFCARGDTSRKGIMAVVLDSDMLTVRETQVCVLPGVEYEKGTGFEGHAFFEAPSIRKINETYYLVYSATVMHELCYATCATPRGKFTYGGVIVSNSDIGIGTYKKADVPAAYGANNHGGLVQILDSWYIFYHRQTNNGWYSRQGCAEKVTIEKDGSIAQVELTSCGLNGGPLAGKGKYPAHIACNLYTDTPHTYVGEHNCPRIMQDGRDGDENPSYIGDMKNSATAAFKYFSFKGFKEITLTVRGYTGGHFEIRTEPEGKIWATLPVVNSNVWEKYTAKAPIPDGIGTLFIRYCGGGTASLLSFELA